MNLIELVKKYEIESSSKLFTEIDKELGKLLHELVQENKKKYEPKKKSTGHRNMFWEFGAGDPSYVLDEFDSKENNSESNLVYEEILTEELDIAYRLTKKCDIKILLFSYVQSFNKKLEDVLYLVNAENDEKILRNTYHILFSTKIKENKTTSEITKSIEKKLKQDFFNIYCSYHSIKIEPELKNMIITKYRLMDYLDILIFRNKIINNEKLTEYYKYSEKDEKKIENFNKKYLSKKLTEHNS